MTAANAKRNTISDEASFNRLSPSIMLIRYLGTFTLLIIVVADTASGGETMPPKRNPRARVNPVINAVETKATTQDVRITIGNAQLVITLLHFQNCFHEVCHAAT